MSFDLKLFEFESSLPFKTTKNGANYFRVYPKKDPSRKFSLKVYNITSDKQKEQIENELKLHLLAAAQHGNVVQIKGKTKRILLFIMIFFFYRKRINWI